MCDDGIGLSVTFPNPVPPGFDLISSIDDNVSQVYGDGDNCGSSSNGTAFTNTTTTPPVAVVKTGTKINVIARTPGGFKHLVSSNSGATHTALTPPSGVVTEIPAAYSKDGTTIDMYGRGTDGRMYHWVYNGTSWSAPAFVGGYLSGPPSAAYVGGSDVVWVTENDGQMYILINGSWFFAIMPPNLYAMSPPQVVLRNSNCLDIYVTASDGHIYRDACWSGSWQQLPGNGFGLMTAVNRIASP